MLPESIRYARSYLFTPATDPRKFLKGIELGADVVVLDLEDSVALTNKINARKNLINFFSTKKPFITAVRINNIRTIEGLFDLQFLTALKFIPDIIFLPKINHAEEINIVRDLLKPHHRTQPAIMSIIESTKAVVNLIKIAKVSDSIIFGSLDFSVDCDLEPTWDSLRTVRTRMIIAAGNANIACIDTAYFDVNDKQGLIAECMKLRQLGFRAKAAIHTSQIETINQIFIPTDAEIKHATQVLNAYANEVGGIKVLDNQMIGPPFVLRTRKILKRASFRKKNDYCL